MTATKPTVKLDNVYEAMEACYRGSLERGRNWHAVTVGIDGLPYCREEVSPCYSESEYFGKGSPHPVTVWSCKGDSSVDADEIDDAVAMFFPREQLAGYGGQDELVRKLEAAGFEVEA